MRELTIPGAFEIVPEVHGDQRGLFTEWYRFDRLAEAVGRPLRLAQANLSVSARGVVRGIHFADVPPGQAKYVTCVRGAVLDVVVDLRVGSPAFGRWEGVRLDDVERRAVYLAEGLGHGFCALTDGATLTYLCSTTYRPIGEHAVHPLDPGLDIEWPADAPQLSDRDAAAPSLAEMAEKGLLPSHANCLAYSDSPDR
ncbi:dTDP-4-dehydrorhamnose 3,5-epimerase family protein [Streptomyces europaeiscabiei]|uniref:dTDP-4-dehydrorhamnose 3,5-epimerase family protein n=1 Tax=Streptomyces europaeiscabiei TaxID=146819 RepID=UPI0018FEE915|nr:dTDP-4-dehydrorhamnose 3,5-epimerase [Streptomyces europaeiscabiei]MDX2522631.1 dTDP-4-dehydrorhamnose 3,5-epimerase [Streptomyces europaeiscabiei]MDX2765466.1 dTDP-4-dehydrorhamnose 3,5-epimerase [Streptomyces europaeiscabiei]MDX2772414.1 dTDP-4-dehydrorhamnose 3,5-epimerase [Streptomyces europaeiscabiei]MDX3709813.1 dTDP-4-dehydrorhamnose 3,5-epimerase [Streptomyces europaeiscabiei]MDX3782195.1 dTDP-4-dehydrorhamnose 3,5-epimerase [Streptomyces europaeiscabiei]